MRRRLSHLSDLVMLKKHFVSLKTFCEFKDIFITALILIHFDFDLKNQVETDALNYTVTEIYTQLQMSEQ